jgi:acetyl-CoA carboxylase biotin carboxyl carrier protein
VASKRKTIRTESAPVARDEGLRVEGNSTSLDVESLRQIVEILEASEVTRLDWQRGDERLLIRRGPVPSPTVVHAAPITPSVSPAPMVAVAPPSAAPAAAAPVSSSPASAAEKPGHGVTSPFVGTFYRTPAPDQPSLVEVGSVVKRGQVLCIIEAMKLMNEIESDCDGEIAAVYLENGKPVQFGDRLFAVKVA